MKWFSRVLIFSVLSICCRADSVVYMRVHRPLIEEQLKLAPATEAARIDLLKDLFHRAGCPQVVEQRIPDQDFPNVICILPGEEEGKIVVGATSDYLTPDATGLGVWSSTAMLPLLAESISHVSHRFTLILIAFSGHQRGVSGAAWYASQLTDAQRRTVQAMIDLDNLGQTPPVFSLGQPESTLATWLHVASQSLRVTAPTQINTEQNGTTSLVPGLPLDSVPFQRAHIPTVTVQSAPVAMLPALRKSGAIAENYSGTTFDIDAYEDTYRLMCVYVLYLDHNLGKPLFQPGIYSGKIVDTAGVFTKSPIDVGVTIDRFTTPEELRRYESILQKGGQEALADALANENQKGTFRFGLDLAYGVKLIISQNSANAPYLFMVSPRVRSEGSTPRNYRFTVIKLNVDARGTGDGLFYNFAELRFNKNHELIIEDFGSKPDPIRQVRMDQPPIPQKIPAIRDTVASGMTTARPSPETAVVSKPSPLTQVAAPGNPSNVATTPSPIPTFHAKAQLVQVDVGVTDAQGRPVQGLQQSDFTVTEDGKPQDIRVFEAHLPGANRGTSKPSPPAPVLAPNTFTNRIAAPADETLNILLLDLLNTPVPDQAYARKQMIEFLKRLPQGKRIAMFVLSRKLVMVQEFSDDSGTLLAAAEKVLTDKSFLLTTESERQEFKGDAENVGRVATPAVNAAGAPAGSLGNLQSGGSLDLGHSQARQRSNAIVESDRTATRVNFTLDALSALARAVSSYPGRKNLVWMSGSFPVRLKPSGIDLYRLGSAASSAGTGLADTPDFQAEVRVATTALATARIAVYPLDVRGVQTAGVSIGVSAAEVGSFSGRQDPTVYGQNLNIQSEARFQERSSMKEVAEQTGGEVLAGNDVGRMIARAIDDGSTYYTVAYTPREDATPRFRKIEVAVSRSKVNLAYRPGYYSGTNLNNPAQTAHPLVVAMQPGMPPSTAIPLTVEVVQSENSNKKIRITYTIDIENINFADTPDRQKRAIFDCIAVAFSKDGVPAAQISNTMDATLPLADYESALNKGLQLRQELEIPPGQYSLRVGVLDRGSQRIGTLDVPLNKIAASNVK